jgi:hypothetical protein
VAALKAAAPYLMTWDPQAAYDAGAAAEREHLAQLAESEAARLYRANFSSADSIAAGALNDFADLITKEDPDA